MLIFLSKPVKDEAGKVILLMPEGRDITERKRAEKDRLANLRFFESMDRVNRAMQGANDLHQAMSDVLDEMLSIFDCDRAWLLYPCDGGLFVARADGTYRPAFPVPLCWGLKFPWTPISPIIANSFGHKRSRDIRSWIGSAAGGRGVGAFSMSRRFL